jgi:hypothetical protein
MATSASDRLGRACGEGVGRWTQSDVRRLPASCRVFARGGLLTTRARPGSSVGTSVRLKSGRSPVRSRPWPPSKPQVKTPVTCRYAIQRRPTGLPVSYRRYPDLAQVYRQMLHVCCTTRRGGVIRQSAYGDANPRLAATVPTGKATNVADCGGSSFRHEPRHVIHRPTASAPSGASAAPWWSRDGGDSSTAGGRVSAAPVVDPAF